MADRSDLLSAIEDDLGPGRLVLVFRRANTALADYLLPVVFSVLAIIIAVQQYYLLAVAIATLGAAVVGHSWWSSRYGRTTYLRELCRKNDELLATTIVHYGQGEDVRFKIDELGAWRFWGDSTLFRLFAAGRQRPHAYLSFTARGHEWRMQFDRSETADYAELQKLAPHQTAQLRDKFGHWTAIIG